MTTEDHSDQQGKKWVMVVVGIAFWMLVKTITFIGRHGLGGNDLAIDHQLPAHPPIVTIYENRELDRQRGMDVVEPLALKTPASTPNNDTPNNTIPRILPVQSKTQNEPNPRPQELPSESHSERPLLASEVSEPLERSGSSVFYGFTPGKDLVYEFDIQAELGPQKFTYRGRNTIQATGNREFIATPVNQVSESTGTGFIIHPDGIVATCAHVVIGATKVSALVDGAQRIATVIAFDEENDIALLRLDKGRFPYLKFASSDEVRLGQEARAIGYPLTDVLGETIKVTRGEVSGRGGPTGSDGIQIDATINPGNSGGPLVDNSGRVIGITSSLLAGIGVSEVGFVVSSNRMIELAKRLGVSVEVAAAVPDELPEMSTPEVIDMVSPATVLLKITSGPKGVGMDPPHELQFTGYCYAAISPSFGRFRSTRDHDEHFNGTMQVDRSGRPLDDDSDAKLPFALGRANLVGIEPLPRSIPGHAISNSVIVIPDWKTTQNNLATDPYGLGSFASRRTPPWMRLPAPPITRTTALVGKESTTVSLGKRKPDGIEVTKIHSVEFEGGPNNEPPLAITGSGVGKFDADEGHMLSMNYKMTVTVNQDNLTVRVPISMNYQLLSNADLDAERLARKEREKDRVKARAAQSAAMGFRAADPSDSESAGESLYRNVKEAPQTRKLNKFNPDQ